MSLLQFLRIIEEVRPSRGKRPLRLESLERRGVLAALADLPVVEAEEPPLPESQPVLEVSPPQDVLPPVENGDSASFDPEPTNGDNPPPPASVAPVITATGTHQNNGWVWFTGTVSDADGPVEGLIVYFTIGTETTVAFTATVNADGTFQSAPQLIAPNLLISAYTIDVDGNQSNIATWYS